MILVPFFMIATLSILLTQKVGLYFLGGYPGHIQALMNLTKTHFVVIITFVASIISPCKVTITYDTETLPKSNSFKVDSSGHLHSQLSPNSVMISNHQIYTDWLFLWFITYTSRLSDSVHIVLKDMSNIPVLGAGMKNFNFLFLSRKWENDKVILTNQLLSLDADARGLGPANGVKHVASANISDSTSEVNRWPEGENPNKIWPYTIILYPEGTVPAIRTTGVSKRYIQKKNLPPLNHVLLPRVRGLFLSLRKLRNTVQVVYDITTGYSNLTEDQYGEDVFTLKRFFLLGIGPSNIHYHLKGWNIADIPLGEETIDIDDAKPEDLQKFEEWLIKIWCEKDALMDEFYKNGKFPTQEAVSPRFRSVTADFKLGNNLEIIPPFITAFTCLLLLRLMWLFIRKFVL